MKSALWLLLVLRLVVGSADVFAASVTLAWDGEPGLGYKVFYGTKSGVYTHTVDAKDAHSVVIDGLADNQVYYFAVRSYNAAGVMSDFSPEVHKTATPSPPAGSEATGPAQNGTPPADRKEARTAGVSPNAAVPANGSASAATAPPANRVPPPVPAATATPPGYLIGPSDVLMVTFWKEKDMNAEAVVVRPDGNITLPLLNDIQAAGLTPGELRERILAEAQRYIEDPNPTVAVKEINSRKVFITGQVEKPGSFPLASPMTVLQLIAMAGGLKEFAEGKNIIVMRTENGRQVTYQLDYRELLKGKNLRQNIDLKPGDTVVVP